MVDGHKVPPTQAREYRDEEESMGFVYFGHAYCTHEQSHQTIVFIKHRASVPGGL